MPISKPSKSGSKNNLISTETFVPRTLTSWPSCEAASSASRGPSPSSTSTTPSRLHVRIGSRNGIRKIRKSKKCSHWESTFRCRASTNMVERFSWWEAERWTPSDSTWLTRFWFWQKFKKLECSQLMNKFSYLKYDLAFLNLSRIKLITVQIVSNGCRGGDEHMRSEYNNRIRRCSGINYLTTTLCRFHQHFCAFDFENLMSAFLCLI